MPQTVVEVRNLTKRFERVTAVNEISFEIYQSEILGILGPNGAGKTTTIQMLLGVTTPTGGQIRIFGLDLARNREEILGRVNFSSTYVSLPQSLTVRENLRVFSQLYQVRNFREKIDHLLSVFEILHLRDTVTRKLSTGQLTRVSLVKALLNDPKILFLDEPTASLDPDIADKTRSLLKSIRAQSGLTILYTSHNMKEMEEMSDRIIFLDKGRIISTGTPAEIMKRFQGEDLEEVFLKVARGKAGV
ncbi:MAG TPA: ABC transporter ATP-binding protein [Nitrospiria bacterium]|nr:ABC transporter ATP-binding protein [Nitrospiria bacterium]